MTGLTFTRILFVLLDPYKYILSWLFHIKFTWDKYFLKMAIYWLTVHWWRNFTKLDRNINQTCAKVFIIITINDAIDLNCSHCVNMMDVNVRKYNWNKWFLRLYYFCLFTEQMLSAYCGGTHVEWYLEMCFLMKLYCLCVYAHYRIIVTALLVDMMVLDYHSLYIQSIYQESFSDLYLV